MGLVVHCYLRGPPVVKRRVSPIHLVMKPVQRFIIGKNPSLWARRWKRRQQWSGSRDFPLISPTWLLSLYSWMVGILSGEGEAQIPWTTIQQLCVLLCHICFHSGNVLQQQTDHFFVITVASYSRAIQTIIQMEKDIKTPADFLIREKMRGPPILHQLHFAFLWIFMHYITLVQKKKHTHRTHRPTSKCYSTSQKLPSSWHKEKKKKKPKRPETQHGAIPVRAIMRAD